MKVLFLDHPEADFMAALLYLGLCQELGPENVVEYPYKKSFHGEVDTYPSFYPNTEFGSTAPFGWFPAQPGRAWKWTEVLDRIAEFDLVVLASPRTHNVKTLEDLVGAVGRKSLKIVMVDGEDYDDIRMDLVLRFRPDVYFKRELMPTATENFKLVPFPLASPVPLRAAVEKDIDVLFIGGATWASRTEACDALRNALGDRFVGGTSIRYDYDAYLDAISRAKIAVSVRGHGYDTLRYWEIPSCPNTLLMADRLPILKPYPFVDGVNASYFSTTEELIKTVKFLLQNNMTRERVARAGNEHLRAHHTAQARAKQLLEESFK